MLHVGLRPLRSRQGGTGPDSELGAPARGRDSVPGNGQEATLYRPLKIKQEPAARDAPSALRNPAGSPAASLLRAARPGVQPASSRSGDAPGIGRRHAPGRSGHLRRAPPTPIPRAPAGASWRSCPRRLHLSGGGWGREAVAVARGQRARLPMAGDGREGRGLPGDESSRWHKFAGRAGTCAGRAPGGLRWAAGLAAGSWLLAAGPGWERGAAPPALGAGRAERGPDVSARGFARPQQGPDPSQAHGGCGPSSRLPLGAPSELPGTRKPEKPPGGWGKRGVGF